MAETRRRRRKKKQQSEYFFDYSLLFIVLFLLGFGLIMIYSASSYEAYDSYGDAAYYMKKQLIANIIGLVFMMVIANIPYTLLGTVCHPGICGVHDPDLPGKDPPGYHFPRRYQMDRYPTYGLQPAACGSSEIVYDPVPGKSGMQDGKKRPCHERLLYHDGGTPADRSIGVPHYG